MGAGNALSDISEGVFNKMGKHLFECKREQTTSFGDREESQIHRRPFPKIIVDHLFPTSTSTNA